MSARWRSSMKPAPRSRSPRYETVISRVGLGMGMFVTVMARCSVGLRPAFGGRPGGPHYTSVDLQQKSLQVLPFRAIQRHRMVGPGREPSDNRNPPSRIDGRREDHLL